MAIALSLWALNGFAQGHGKGHGNHGKQHSANHGKHGYGDNHHKNNNVEYRNGYRYDHGGHHNTTVYRHYYPIPRPVSVRVTRPYERPRYVYFPDYDVYFDQHHNHYVRFDGHHWIATPQVPHCMMGANLALVTQLGFNFHHDNLIGFLEINRPGARIIAHW